MLGKGIALIALMVTIAGGTALDAQTAVPCDPSASGNAGWCVFATPVAFKKDERLRLAIGGSAKKVIVRLLPKGADPTTPIGVIPTVMMVPKTRYLEVIIPHNEPAIIQISVHGGPSPWGQYPLGVGNGPATITGVERLPAPARGKSGGPALDAQTAVPCTPGASGNAGWCVFATPVAFKKGDHLRLAIGGSAKKVIVRLLPNAGDPTTPIGVIPTALTVPKSRYLEVTVPHDAPAIIQVSVHGGPSPWNQYPLGAGNGPATITGAERLSARAIRGK